MILLATVQSIVSSSREPNPIVSLCYLLLTITDVDNIFFNASIKHVNLYPSH
jgi:hypothetical protein